MISGITFDDISPEYLSVFELERHHKLLEEIDVRCTFLVVPFWNVSHSVKHYFSLCLRKVSESGHEIALHGYKHLKNEFGGFYPFPLPFVPYPSFKKQRELLEKATKLLEHLTQVRPQGFRAPFYLYNKNTLKALSDLGFKYDSSKTIFKPTHHKLFRIRLLHEFRPHKVHDVIEIPVTGDYTYNLSSSNFSDLLKSAIHDLKWMKSREGVFIINVHINRSNNYLLNRFLQIFVNKAKKITEFVRLIDIVNMYRRDTNG
jgi:peptidoglycan/xylan/chitin deacetylase (PgdA/CDA1 family)